MDTIRLRDKGEGRGIGVTAQADPATRIIGEHASMRSVRHLVQKVAQSPASSILIYGETGTGKGVVAHCLHDLSPRASRQFVDINCAAIPESLVESELFGFERGAFTGAAMKKIGLIEAADQGTVFLDEVRELNHVIQAKLLSLLDTRQFRRIGSVRPIEVDVRFIAATNRILFSEVRKGNFREDLYYRLQVVAINLPPLRERGDDVFLLTDHFLNVFTQRYGRLIRGLEPAVTEVFAAYRWPGNVRELENLLERIFVLEEDDLVRIAHIPPRILREVETPEAAAELRHGEHHHGPPCAEGPSEASTHESPAGDYYAATAAFQRQLIADALAASGSSVTDAARRLGLSRHALRHQMMKLHIPDA